MNNREMIDEPFNDGEHIVYVNGANKDGATELGKLMHDFFCTDPDDMHFKELADKVRYFKEDEKGVAAMCKVMEDIRSTQGQRQNAPVLVFTNSIIELSSIVFLFLSC